MPTHPITPARKQREDPSRFFFKLRTTKFLPRAHRRRRFSSLPKSAVPGTATTGDDGVRLVRWETRGGLEAVRGFGISATAEEDFGGGVGMDGSLESSASVDGRGIFRAWKSVQSPAAVVTGSFHWTK